MTDVKEPKPNATYEKVIWWYENHPNGPYPRERRDIGRDVASIKRDFRGSIEDWKTLCERGWNHKDPSIAHYSRLRVTSFVGLLPRLVEISGPSPEEIAASVKAIEAITESVTKGLSVRTKVVYRNGMPVEVPK